MAQTIVSQRLPQTEPIGTTDFHQDGVQLPGVDLVPNAPQLPERKPGGPLDRSKWVVSWAPHLGHPAFKLLAVMNDYSNPEGRCFPSRKALMVKSGMSGSAVDRGLSELKVKGAIRVVVDGKAARTANIYQLTGGSESWGPAKPEHSPKVGRGYPRKWEGGLSPKVGNGTLPFSSNPKLEPGSGQNDQVFNNSGRKRKSSERQTRAPRNGGEQPQSPQPTSTLAEPRISAPPAPAPPAVSPDHPPTSWMPGYCQVMLRRYRQTWLDAWDQEEEKVIRYYKTRWPKFLEDLQRHRANELANVPYGGGLKELDDLDQLQPEKPPELVNCSSCGTTTTNPKGPVFRRVGGELESDACFGCDRVTLELAATAN